MENGDLLQPVINADGLACCLEGVITLTGKTPQTPQIEQSYIVWFRHEVSRTVKLAGNPHKNVQVEKD